NETAWGTTHALRACTISIIGFFNLRLHSLQSKVEDTALIRLRISPNPAAVFLHDAPHRSQSYPIAFKIFGVVQSYEDSEELARELWIKAHSVVADKNDRFTFCHHMPDLNHGWLPIARKFHRVGD